MKQAPNKVSSSSQNSHARLIIISEQQPIAKSLHQQIEKTGFEVLNLSLPGKVVSIASQALEDIFSEIAVYEWAIFANVEAVRTFFQGFFERYRDLRSIGPMRFVSLSSEATNVIRSYHLEVEFETTEQKDAIDQVIEEASVENEKVLVVGPEAIVQPIAHRLESEERAIVDRYPYEQRQSLIGLNLEIAEQFQRGGAHYMLFVSPEAVDAFLHHARLLTLKSTAKRPKAIALNHKVAQKLRQHQIPTDIELNTELGDSLAAELVKLLKG